MRYVKIIYGNIEFTDDTADILDNLFEESQPIDKAEDIAEGRISKEYNSYIIPELYTGTIL